MTKKMKKNKPVDMNKGFKVENPKETFKRILTYLKPYKWQLLLALVFMLISVGIGIAGTFMLSILIEKYITPLAMGSTAVTLTQFGIFVGCMLAIYMCGAFLHYFVNFIIVKATTKIMQDIRDEMFVKMQALPIKYFDTHTHGDLMSCFTNDTDTLREFLSNSLPNMITNAVQVVGVFVMMMVINPVLTLVTVGVLAIMMVCIKFIGGKSAKHFVGQQRSMASVNGFIEEHIEGMKVVKVFCHESKEKDDFDKVNDELCYASRKANTYANILMPIMGNLSHVNYAITAIVGSLFAISGFMTMNWGKLVSFMTYTRQFSNPLGQMAQQINAILMGLAGAERIFALIDATPETDEGYVTLVNIREGANGEVVETEEYTGMWAWRHYHKATDSVTYVKWTGAVEFEDVTFGYDENKIVLKHINMQANPGQKIALVGSTGAGKTTITNLINRFYDIQDGKIRYDGINIQKIKKDDLRHSLAMVLQDTHLFTGTVRENIRFGKLDATDEQVEAAAKLANADYFIQHLPEGYDTVISGDGGNLSQGQRQLLAIARAAVANPPVLILDEATSSIDTRTEKLIEQGMDKLMVGRTVFVIAHRLSTVRNADVILVLEHGEIIERGNHEQLIEQKGKYYQLYTGAFELE